jgi:hypothetical protein
VPLSPSGNVATLRDKNELAAFTLESEPHLIGGDDAVVLACTPYQSSIIET